MLILPAIDLRGGRCVRLMHGDYSQESVYAGDPADVAKEFEDCGAQFIHVVDLDGAKKGEPENLDAVARICRRVRVPVEFGGGIRSLEVAQRVLNSGVDRVIVGTKLVTDRELANQFWGALREQVVAGIDARNGKVAIAGWTETTEIDALELAAQLEKDGAKRFILTDIARDGALSGPNIEFWKSSCLASVCP